MRITLLVVLLVSGLQAQFVHSGKNTLDDLKRGAYELRSAQRVLFVAYAPSSEDLERIAAARLAEHASVTLVYLTNGESMPDGEGVPYPNQLAARWREKAWKVATLSGSAHQFLNLPYIDAAASIERVRALWPADTVREQWRKMVQELKPDAVVISGFEHFPQDNPVVTAFLSDVASATRRAARGRGWVPLQIAFATGLSGRKGGTGPAQGDPEGMLRAVYGRLAPGPELQYRYREFDWRKSALGRTLASSRLFPERMVPASLTAIDSSVRALSAGLVRLRSMPTGKKREQYLIPLVDAMGTVDLGIAQVAYDADAPRRFLLDWKLSLEQIRGTLLGVRVWWSLSEHILTERQLSHLRIDSISGLDADGRTEIFFPEVRNGWVVNEAQGNHHPYVRGQEYRILSPAAVPYDLPRAFSGLSRPVFQSPWYIFVVHQAKTAEYNFSFRIDLGILGSPRFSPEILTPVVRAVDGEEVAFRLTNHSRDGVSDSAYAFGRGVRSEKSGFRLLIKDKSHLDTLHLEWMDAPAGAYLVDLMIGNSAVANFLARRFPVITTEGKQVTMVGLQTSSALYQALRRLGYSIDVVEPREAPARLKEAQGPVLVDENLDLYEGATPDLWSAVRSAGMRGNHVILFSQHAATLKESGLLSGMNVTPTYEADTSHTIVLAGNGDVFRRPNDMSGSTWEGWLDRIASNSIDMRTTKARAQAVFEKSGMPVILSLPLGSGRLTYVDLNLSAQWANVLPAAYELLANIIENEDEAGGTR